MADTQARDKPADGKAAERAKPAGPDPAQATHFVVLHHMDHHIPGRVLKAVDVPDDQRASFAARYTAADCREIDRAAVARLINFRAIRPASEDEAKADTVPVSPWEGQAPHVNANLVISRSEVEGYRQRIRTLESQKGSPEEMQRLRDRVAELEGKATADRGAGVPRAKGHPEG